MATDETRARMIEAAGPIFAEKGFRDATVREICDKAGVGLASVNYHFRDKQHLYVEVVESAFDRLMQTWSPLTQWPSGTPARARLQEWIERLTRHVLGTPKDSWEDRLLTREFAAPTPACEGILRKRLDREMAPLLEILEDLLPPEATSAERWRLALSIIGQVILYDCHRDLIRLLPTEMADAEAFNPERVAEHVTRVLLAALGLAAPIGRPPQDQQA